MDNYTDADLAAAYGRLARAVEHHQSALRQQSFADPILDRERLDRLGATFDVLTRCFNRYDVMARAIAKKPLSERPRPA